jgi:putative FmdB family regulatory protein
MPTYEYRCTSCGNRFDVFQRHDEESLRVCERCGGELRKVFHPAGIVFKGSGFYATDSRTKAPSSDGAAKVDSKADPKGGSKGESKKTDTSKPSQKSKAGEGSSS